jgi:hypothetical protein
MADRYDPKLSVRPLSERRPAAPADESDPLIELARIVSGRTTFDPAPAPKAKTVPAAPNGALSAEPTLANDLESELMNDLQASFAAVAPPPKPAAPARPAPANPPAPAAARPAPPPVPKTPSAAPAKPAPPQAPAGAFIPPKVATPPQRPAAPAPAAAKPAAPPASRPATPPPAARTPAPPVSERPPRPAAPAPRAERPAPPAPVKSSRPTDRGDVGSASLRPTAAAHAEPPAPPSLSARWEKSAEPEAGPSDDSRFAPPRARNWFRASRNGGSEPAGPSQRAYPPPPEPEVTDADHEMFDDAPPTLAEADDLYHDDLALEEIAHYGDDEADLPPLVDELPDMGHRRSSRGAIAVGALLIVALVGGAGYLMLRGVPGTAGTPPVIAADPGPTKITPPDDGSQQTADAQNKLIYDRIDPAAKPAEDTTHLVTPGSEKIADVNKPADADDGNPVSRVIMQGGPAYDGTSEDDGTDGVNAPAKVGDGGAAASPSSDGDDGIGPRKVRTVVVRPDGTIVSSEAAPADGSAAPAVSDPSKPPSEVAGSLNVPQGGTSMDTVLDKGGNIPVNADPLASDTGAGAPAPAGTVPASDGGAAAPAAPAGAQPAQPAQVAAAEGGDAASSDDGAAAAAPEPPAKPAAAPKPKTVVAKGEPIDLTPAKKAAPAADPADAAAITGGLSVQVTSQKSEAAALSAYRGLQSRYAQVLGRYQPNVQRADLGDRGTYYRVRVGPFAGDGASRVCAALKAAGGDCIIVK